MTQSDSRESYALPLEAVSRADIDLVGGKAANLGEVIAANLPVPTGFCVTTRAYAMATEGAELSRILDAIAKATNGDVEPQANTNGQPGELDILAASARDAISRAPVPRDVDAAIRQAYDELCKKASESELAVAVRSSATAEDLPGASFAGQQDTYLNVIGSEAVVDAVRRCWASLWTDRAVAYRARNHTDPHGVRLAVVVQQQIQSAIAGVMFTANPLTGRRGESVIDASPGLGEAVVSGAVTPDHFVVASRSGQIVERRLGDKRLRIESIPGGGTRRIDVAEDPTTSQTACISDAQLKQLADLGLRVERYYGEPQDTEWAIDAERVLWLLQARPITTLYPLPLAASARDEGALRVYFSFNVAQGVYQPLTPMGMQAFKLLGSGVANVVGMPIVDAIEGPSGMAEAGHRLFFDITTPLRNPLGRIIIPTALTQMEARSAEVLGALIKDPRFSRVRGSRPAAALGIAKLALRSGVPQGVLRTLIDPDGAGRRVRHLADSLLRKADLPTHATAPQRLDRISTLPDEFAKRMLPHLFPLPIAGLLALNLAQHLLKDIATSDEMNEVRRGLPNNPTTEMDLALWDLAQRIRSDASAAQKITSISPDELARGHSAGELPTVAQRGLSDFLAIYGHRGVAEIDLGVPHWADDPAHILGVLANYLALTDPALAPDVQFRRVSARANALVGELAERAGRKGWLRGQAVRFFLGRFRKLGGLRESTKFYLVKMLYAMRQMLATVGQELVDKEQLQSSSDVYLLTLPELRAAVAGADVQPIVRRRREELAFETQRRRVPRVLLSDGSEPEAMANRSRLTAGNAETLEGSGASSGRVSGVARVILDPHGARLEPREILVAPSTDPGWTPLFLTAGGLVMEMGGPMSHGAIVAREYGIPAVVGVPHATDLIKSGQTITVDGSAGLVTLDAPVEA